MAVYTGFTPSQDFAWNCWKVKRGEIDPRLLENLNDPDLRIIMTGVVLSVLLLHYPFIRIIRRHWNYALERPESPASCGWEGAAEG